MPLFCEWLSCHSRKTLLAVLLLLCPLLSFFVFCSYGVESDVRRGFAQKGGRSMTEFKNFAEFYNITSDGLEIWVVLVTSKRSSGNKYMNMSIQVLNEIERLDEFVASSSTVVDGNVVHFSDMRSTKINYVFHWYKYAYSLSKYFSDINLTFPVSETMGHKFFIGNHFFGVNRGQEKQLGPIETMEYVTLWYMNQAEHAFERRRLQAIQMELFKICRYDNFSDMISFEIYGDQIANVEMLRGTFETVKFFVLGVILMIVFMAIVFNHIAYRSQPVLILGAIGVPAIATATCFAILGWIDFPFNSIMCITPFLVTGIGVDDAFLLLHSWRRHGHLAIKERMHVVVHEIGPSMAITSATNTLAFGIGIASSTPQMSAFCLCTSIAIFLDFVFEFLIFCPLLALFYKEREVNTVHYFAWISWENYINVLFSPFGRYFAVVLMLSLYVCAFVGVREMKPTFDPSKTFPRDSDLLLSLRKFERIQYEYTPVNFISVMPDLSNPHEMKSFFEMVNRLENSENCYGPARTQLMLRNFIEWEHTHNNSLSYDDLPQFLNERQINDKVLVHYQESNGTVEFVRMNYIVICQGDLDWNRRAMKIDFMRKVTDEYPKFRTSVFDYDSTIYDLIITVKEELTKSVLITFLCMIVACAFIIPSFIGASIAAVSMLSISFPLLGFLSIWGQDLDPVTMINVLMAIGFSVDFSAHVCYHHHLATKERSLLNDKERVVKVLRTVGKPMFEASFSTLICMTPLFFVPVYIFVSFAKTVCLVSALGLLHGMVIIPVCLSVLSGNQQKTLNSPVLNEQKEPMVNVKGTISF